MDQCNDSLVGYGYSCYCTRDVGHEGKHSCSAPSSVNNGKPFESLVEWDETDDWVWITRGDTGQILLGHREPTTRLKFNFPQGSPPEARE